MTESVYARLTRTGRPWTPLLHTTLRVCRWLTRAGASSVPVIRDAIGTRFLSLEEVSRACEGLLSAGLIEACGEEQLGSQTFALYRLVQR